MQGIRGKGPSEVVYKDALEYEFSVNQIPFSREKSYKIKNKNIVLPRGYNADFVVYDKIIREVIAIESLANGYIKQTLNYTCRIKAQIRITG